MKTWIAGMLLCLGQMNTLREKPVVHLDPYGHSIPLEFGGKRVELIHAPRIVDLPRIPPKADIQGDPWMVEVKNLGPGPVTVVDENSFHELIPVGLTLRIYTNGRSYSVKH